MAGHDRPPQHQLDEGTQRPQERTIDPYVSFVGAFLRQLVTDALSTPKGTGDWTEATGGRTEARRCEAQAFLLDPNCLAPWIELTGADVDKMQGVLLRAAGLARTPQKVP
jgi:hypothetical protein